MAWKILLIDDEPSILETLSAALEDEHYQVFCAQNGEKGLKLLQTQLIHLVFLDIWMPGKDGLQVLQEIRKLSPETIVIMMSGHGTIETAVKATKLGAYDFIEKPLSLEKILILLQNALSHQTLARENKTLRKQVQKQKILIGQSAPMNQLRLLIEKVAKTSSSVLICGENGTGKELIAHSIYTLSSRFSKPFIEINCAAIPETLIESELFGHEKGAFTGAIQMKKGKFDLAHQGTLFLDEIADMSLQTQAKILRILQEQTFERIGGTQKIHVNVRIIAATNKDLKAEIQKGTFREDLYYRLNVIPFHIPPLRNRQEDIPLLAKHFLKFFSQLHLLPQRVFSSQALEVLKKYNWPGNVRELKNLIERVFILSDPHKKTFPISASEILEHLQTEAQMSFPNIDPSGDVKISLKEARNVFEKDFISQMLRRHQWNISKTAQALGLERSYLHRKIKSLGLETPTKEMQT